MDYSIKYNIEQDYFHIFAKGKFEIGRLLSLVDDLLTHQHWGNGENCIFDYRNCDLSEASDKELKFIFNVHLENNFLIGNGKPAFVVNSITDYCLAGMYQGCAGNYVEVNFNVFTNFDHALEWICIQNALSQISNLDSELLNHLVESG